MPERSYLIGEFAEEFGVTLRTLRFYQDRGLLSPRREGKTRIYSEADRARLARIVAAKRLGFTLAEIGPMLAKGMDAGEALPLSPQQVQDQILYLKRQKAEILQALAELRARLGSAGAEGTAAEPSRKRVGALSDSTRAARVRADAAKRPAGMKNPARRGDRAGPEGSGLILDAARFGWSGQMVKKRLLCAVGTAVSANNAASFPVGAKHVAAGELARARRTGTGGAPPRVSLFGRKQGRAVDVFTLLGLVSVALVIGGVACAGWLARANDRVREGNGPRLHHLH